MMRKHILINALAAVLCLSVGQAFANPQNPEIQKFIQQMVKTHHFKQNELDRLFANFKPNEKIIANMNKPYESKPWDVYRKLFLQPKRVQYGVEYWKQHKADLSKAQQQYGVPASVIVAILGVESMYGRHTGKYSVFNSLATLDFNYPKRSKFFRYELTNYLLLSHEEQFPVLKAKGSYAGAMGMMQFMPSNIRKYAVGDLKKQLFNPDRSAIFSIANYLKSHGWKKGQDIATPVTMPISQSWISKNAKKFYPAKLIDSAGLTVPANVSKVSFIKLPKDPNSNTWMIYPNFRAIMSYNPRIPYAMAVFQLSQAISKEMQHS